MPIKRYEEEGKNYVIEKEISLQEVVYSRVADNENKSSIHTHTSI